MFDWLDNFSASSPFRLSGRPYIFDWQTLPTIPPYPTSKPPSTQHCIALQHLSHPSIFSKFFRLSRSLGYSSLLAHILVLAARLTVERKVFYAQPALPPFNTMRSVYTRTWRRRRRGREMKIKAKAKIAPFVCRLHRQCRGSTSAIVML